MSQPRRKVISLFQNFRLNTTGVTGAGGVYSYIDLDVPALNGVLIYAEELAIEHLQVGGPASGELEWNIELVPGFDRNNEKAAVALVTADINADGTARNAGYTTVTDFMTNGRLRIRHKNKNAVSGVRSALISAYLLVTVLAS